MEEAILHAKKFVEDMLSFFGLNTDVRASSEDDVIEISVPSTHLNGFLIGHNGETLRAIQSLTISSLKTAEFEYSRVNVDIANYKKQQNDKIAAKAQDWAKEVADSGKNMDLQPMNSAERRIVHKTIDEYGAGLTTESQGEGRDRHIVIKAVSEE